MRTDADKKRTFDNALALRDAGKYEQAADLFLDLAKGTDNLFEKAGMLLNATHALQRSGRFDLARNQLDLARQVLSFPSGTALENEDEENRRRLSIWAELEDSRLYAAQDKLLEALAMLNGALTNHRSEFRSASFADIYQAVQRDRAFLLTDLRFCQEALPILEKLDSADPHDRWTLFYKGYCYLSTGKYVEAQQKLEEAIQLGLTPDFEGRAHCALGAACYELKDYDRAKLELEKGVNTASPRYIKQAKIWQLLEYTSISLGLRTEAEHYGRLARSS